MHLVEDIMKHFKDLNGAEVSLSFQENAFGQEPNHVLIVCKYKGKWVLTDHKQRGWEFPGGKREEGETLEQAALREVMEETGGKVQSLHFIGEYEVKDERGSFVKRIYSAELKEILNQKDYFETNGPVLIEGDLLSEVSKKHYSFIMKDEVIRLSLEQIK
jgi:8-oxo-dGTP diphosphatase